MITTEAYRTPQKRKCEISVRILLTVGITKNEGPESAHAEKNQCTYGLSGKLKIRQKQSEARQTTEDKSRWTSRVASQKQVRCEAGQWQDSWRVIFTCF